MEKENLEIKKASEGLTAEDLKKVNGGIRRDEIRPSGDSPKKCSCD